MSEKQDHEYSMARSELATIMSAAKRLRSKMKGEGEIKAWVQSKITKAADYLDTAADYVDSGEVNEESKKCKNGYYWCYTDKKCKKIPMGYHVGGRGMLEKDTDDSESETKKNGNGNGNGNGGNGGSSNGNGGNGGTVGEEVVKEGGSLHTWFKGSKSKDGKPGWVQSDGSPCANEPGETKTPKCYSSKRLAALKRKGKKGENIIKSADRRKREKDPGQQSKTGAAKPTNVKTFAKGKKDKNYVKPEPGLKEMTEFKTLPLQIEIPNNIRDFNLGLMFRENLDFDKGMLFIFEDSGVKSFHMSETKIPLDIAFITEDGRVDSIKSLEPYDKNPVSSEGEVMLALEVNRGWFAKNDIEVGDEFEFDLTEAAKDRKGKGSGSKDACYHKVKSRYSVWPSAYASGALVKCRKVGAANWGNKSESFSDWRHDLDEKCWAGYEKKGMKTMFGKRYPNCVKKEGTQYKVGDTIPASATGEADYKKKRMNTLNRIIKDNPKNWDFSQKNVDRRQITGESVEITDAYGETFAVVDDVIKPEKMEATVCPRCGKNPCECSSTYETYDIEAMTEAVRLPQKVGNIVRVYLYWRGNYYNIAMFFPQVSIPTRQEMQAQIDKVYPGARLMSFKINDYQPGEPLVHTEDWQKVNKADKTDGMSKKAVAAYRRENPGSKLKTAVTGDPKPGSKDAKRRKSFCSRSAGQQKMHNIDCSKTPDKAICKARRRWKC